MFHGVELREYPGFPGLADTPAAPAIASLIWSSARGQCRTEEGGQFREGLSGLEMSWDGYARYEVALSRLEGVADVVVDSIDESEAARGFLFSVLPVALPLVNLEPLHGAAVATDDHATLLLGPSGSGKSSVAAALADLGHFSVCDDACAIDEHLRIWPGPPLVTPRWRGSRLPDVGEYNGKVLLAGTSGPRDPQPIQHCLVLDPVAGASIEADPLPPREALPRLLENTRDPRAFSVLRREMQFHVAAGLSRATCIRLTFDPRHHAFDDLARHIDAVIRG